MKLNLNTTTNEAIKVEARIKLSSEGGRYLSTFDIGLFNDTMFNDISYDYDDVGITNLDQWVDIKVIFPPFNATYIDIWFDGYMHISYLKITKYTLSE